MIFILDACSAINLLHIFKDDDISLQNIFENYNVTFTKKVLEEINTNLFSNKLSLKLEKKQSIRDKKNIFFKRNEYEDKNSQKYLQKTIKYNKLNGEFFSSALALNLSRLEKDYIFFVTDDIPAKNEFNIFFQEHKIGDIISTAEFLYIFYQLHHESISIKESFFNLKIEYLIEIKNFEEEIANLMKIYQNRKEYYFLDNIMSYLKNIKIENLQTFEIETRLPQDIKEKVKEIKEYINQSFINKKILFNEIDKYIKLIQEKREYRL